MTKFFFALMLATFTLGAQTTKDPGDFKSLKVFDKIQTEIIPSDANRVEISGNRSSDVEVVNNNGQLKIRMALKKMFDGDDILVKVYFRQLNAIDASEGSYVGCAEPIKQDFISLNAKEGAQIKLQLAVDKAELRSVTGGMLKLSGTADVVDARLGTGGILEAEKLETRQTDIDIKAGGDASVFATQYVNATVKGGGHVDVYGNPNQVNQKTALGGSVKVH
jgi:hypothetical protein